MNIVTFQALEMKDRKSLTLCVMYANFLSDAP